MENTDIIKLPTLPKSGKINEQSNRFAAMNDYGKKQKQTIYMRKLCKKLVPLTDAYKKKDFRQNYNKWLCTVWDYRHQIYSKSTFMRQILCHISEMGIACQH